MITFSLERSTLARQDAARDDTDVEYALGSDLASCTAPPIGAHDRKKAAASISSWLLIRAVRHAAQRTPEVRPSPSKQSIVQRRANHRWATEHSGLERCPHSRASRSTALGGIAHAHF